MILLLDVDKDGVYYCLKDNDLTIKEGKEHDTGLLKEKLCRINRSHEIKMVGYRVQDGGPAIGQPVMELTSLLAANIEKSPLKVFFGFCAACFESSRHFILCDSAFFLNMPEYVRPYAIPFEYTHEGLVRHPRNGIVHDWALKRLATVQARKRKKIITVFLNDGADVVALKGGRPVMTSQGFSDFDGIISQTGCGPIDTSIVFQLFSARYSLEGIDRVLSQESGFKALMGKKLKFADLIVRKGPKAALARDIFSYQLIKTIGACVAVLEGLDSIVFIGDGKKELQNWAYDLLRQMEFMGLKRHKGRTNQDMLLTTADSPVEAYYFRFDKWSAMSQLLA